ncbi:MAG TPA: nuclear transport factor 2 family protein, partial [Acidimicrobiales bacterium]|nr:nuclear transport factor 2 family protein [Acidimicrobiales bacterium]
MGVVEDWVNAYNARDFAGVARCLSKDDFERVGPYMDVISSSAEYVAFLERVVPTLGDDYRLDIERVVYVPDAHVAYAELIEHYRHDGDMRDTPEIIVF